MKELVPKSIVELSQKYVPILKKLEAIGARAAQREFAVIKNARRIESDRMREEEIRQIAFRRRRQEFLLLRRPKRESAGLATLLRQKWMEHRTYVGDEGFDDIFNVDEEALSSNDWLFRTPSSIGDTTSDTARPQPTKKKLSKTQQALTAALAKPDPFIVAAPQYRDATAARLVCRKCDHTLSRGVRGTHLFSWNDNYHIAINDEIVDTISFKHISDPNEMQKSLWKRAKVACPCCGSSVGTLGVTHARMKVMFKGVCVAWRSTSDVASQVGRPFPRNSSTPPMHFHGNRPIGSSLSSTWLLSNAGLMTHNRRWVLDSSVLNAVVHITENTKGNLEGKATSLPPVADVDPLPGGVLRASEKEPASLSQSMKRLSIRAMAVENLTMISPVKGLKAFTNALAFCEKKIAEEAEMRIENVLKADALPREKQQQQEVDIVNDAIRTGIKEQEEDEEEEPYESDLESSYAFVRLTALHLLADAKEANEAASATIMKWLTSTKQGMDLLSQCGNYIKSKGNPVSFVSARTLCSAARLFSEDKEVLEAIVDILAERKENFGTAGGAFGRSAEYLQAALKDSGKYNDEDVSVALGRATSLHPSPGARFGVEMENSGFAELFCSHGDGTECSRRATHAPPPPPGMPVNVRDPKLKIPTMCRIHAPAGFVATAEGYRGVIPPFEDPARQRPGGLLPVVASGHPQHFAQTGWYGRKNNRMVDVPDPHMTEFGPPEPGTLSLGAEWEQSVKVCYTSSDLKEAIEYFDAHLAKAEELAKANGGVPSVTAAIGLDVEWKPEFTYSVDNNICSIIQIATREKAFIFDAIALGRELEPLMRRLFRSRDVIKIGHGLAEDLARIAQGIARQIGNADHAREFFPVESLMELAPLFSKAESKTFAYGTLPSLVSMVEAATGLRLDKRCQMTDWERRPLSPAQIRYAATDAACGFLLFDEFAKRIQQMSGQKGDMDIATYLQKDLGTTMPQRAGMAQWSNSLPTPSSSAQSGAPSSIPTMPASTTITPAGSGGAPFTMTPSAGNVLHHHHHHHHHPRMGLLTRSGSAVSRTSAVPRSSNRKLLSKHEMRRVRELQNDLMSQGVKVDEHAKLEGLEVASEHLQKSLSKVVRESLVDPPTALQSTGIPNIAIPGSMPSRT